MHRFANPGQFLRVSGALLPWVSAGAILCLATGLIWGFVFAPPDYQQGESVRIIYIHVPAAWMAMFVYTCVAAASASALIWRHPLGDLIARAASPLGAGFAFIALVSGSLWGKPMWGTYWVWDARLTSMLILFFLYLGHMALAERLRRRQRGNKAAPSWLSSASSMCRSSNSRSIGGNPASAGERVPHGRAYHRSLDPDPDDDHGPGLHPLLRQPADPAGSSEFIVARLR